MTALRHAALALLLTLAACAIQPEIAEFPGAAQQVRRFYERNAFEENATCTTPRIAAIISSRTITDTPEQLVLEVRYRFEPFNRTADFGTAACIDWNTRQFTFERSGEALRIVGMTGEQRVSPRTPIGSLVR
jgi:hypothetical protein